MLMRFNTYREVLRRFWMSVGRIVGNQPASHRCQRGAARDAGDIKQNGAVKIYAQKCLQASLNEVS